MFVRRKEYYKRVGKAWKCGYLLFGPPRTGKSSLVGAIANYLNFDIYKLQLNHVPNDACLRNLLLGIGTRTILLVEDIDRLTLPQTSKDMSRLSLPQTSTKVGASCTLGGLLNIIDEIWSSQGEELIIIFTTNNKNLIDPALLRPRRMDVHINMGSCCFDGFKTMTANYLEGITEPPLFSKIENLIERDIITLAKVVEVLMRTYDVDMALKALIKLFEKIRLDGSAEDEGIEFDFAECCFYGIYRQIEIGDINGGLVFVGGFRTYL